MLEDSVIFLTGGTGSLGQAVVREGLKHKVKSIRIFSRNEYLQWKMKQELDFQSDKLRWMIGDVRDADRVAACMRGSDIVIHAAALKHVSTGQYNPQEVIKTNIMGSVNVVDVAAQIGVRKVLAISSDKAVEPSCLYGSTKQIMETLMLEANRWAMPKTMFSCFRSGNFVESHGNVFEVWAKQAEKGEVTLTSMDMHRFFIPVNEVAKIALLAVEAMRGNEIFVPKMNEYAMIDLLKQRYPDARIKITGEGEGEKLRESLFTKGEINRVFAYDDYYVIRPVA